MPELRNVNPQKRAEELLKRLGIHSNPTPVEKIAKSLGAVVRFSPLDEELSGMIYIKDDVPIIGINSLHHPNRQRFTIAHEIGHLELHKTFLTASVHVDKKFPIMMRGVVAAQGTDRKEIAALRRPHHTSDGRDTRLRKRPGHDPVGSHHEVLNEIRSSILAARVDSRNLASSADGGEDFRY